MYNIYIWLSVHYNKIPIYPIFDYLRGTIISARQSELLEALVASMETHHAIIQSHRSALEARGVH